ncbi:hypothetical protein ACO34A_03980 [Rhizobium sp. ACO-34A]|nr:hypothetical protein [Rhizobium sp. ACO-34A]ATN32960.1 hypothetical protein ACO34A_03980 [Rhizobium sp. ACO-34A]
MAKRKIYEALVDGAATGLVDAALYAYVQGRCPQVNNKKLVRAALLALTDPHLADRNILQTIYALAIKTRLEDLHASGSEPSERSQRENKVATSEKQVLYPA